MGVTIDKLLGQPLMHSHESDNNKLYIRKTNANTPDIGAEQDSSIDGITREYITDKRISHCLIGANDREEEGAIRVANGVFQLYANGTWNDVVINFVFREDSDGSRELEHQPIGLEYYYEVMSGNSDRTAIDGRPIFQQYSTDIGAYQTDLIISGGTF